MCTCETVEEKTYEASEAQAAKDEAKIEVGGRWFCSVRMLQSTRRPFASNRMICVAFALYIEIAGVSSEAQRNCEILLLLFGFLADEVSVVLDWEALQFAIPAE